MGAGVRRALVEAQAVTSPVADAWNLSPSSTEFGSLTDAMLGVGLELNRLTMLADAALTVREADALAVPPRPSETAYVNDAGPV